MKMKAEHDLLQQCSPRKMQKLLHETKQIKQKYNFLKLLMIKRAATLGGENLKLLQTQRERGGQARRRSPQLHQVSELVNSLIRHAHMLHRGRNVDDKLLDMDNTMCYICICMEYIYI